MKKQFDDDTLVDFIVIPILIVFAIVVWWLCSIPKPPNHENTQRVRIVENYVESVEKYNIK
jgi:hypothetical protein